MAADGRAAYVIVPNPRNPLKGTLRRVVQDAEGRVLLFRKMGKAERKAERRRRHA